MTGGAPGQGDADVGRQLADALAGDDDAPEPGGEPVDGSADVRTQGVEGAAGSGAVVPVASEAERFLRHVLPEPGKGHGHYCLGFLRQGQFSHDVLGIIEGAATRAVTKAAAPDVDVYFALFTLLKRQVKDDVGKVRIRVRDNAAFCRCLALDLDCGKDKHGREKDYPDQHAAAAALVAFGKAVGLPRPTLVSSGHGWHVYWTFDRALSRDAWLDLATNFRRLIDAHGFRADRSKVTDVTAVLRVPGTVNRKFTDNLQPVRVMAWGQHTPVERIMAVIDGALAALAAAGGVTSRGPLAALQPAAGATGTTTRSLFDFSGPEAISDALKKLPPPDETRANIDIVEAMLAALDPDCERGLWRDIVWAVLATRWDCAEELARKWSMGA